MKKIIKYAVVAFLFGAIPLAAFVWRAIELSKTGILLERAALLVIYLLIGVLAYIRFARNRY